MKDTDPFDLAALEAAETAAGETLRQERQIEIDDFKFVMEDKRGRRYVWRLLEQCGVFRSSFTGNSETFFREGQRNVGLKIISLIHEACPEKYALMLKEQREYGRRKPSSSRST